MQEIKLFNGSNLEYGLSLNYLKKKNYGIGFFFLKFLNSRFELNFNSSIASFYFHQWVCLHKFLISIVPKDSSFKKRKLLNIFFLDVINSYKGWRHSHGLPVRGQRTWTNANSSYKSNVTLRYFKINSAKRIYGSSSIHETTVAYFAEQINLLWKLQWEKEWLSAKKKRTQIFKKKTGSYKIDLYSMAKGQVSSGDSLSSKKKNKKKKEVGKNVFLLGFDPGFTKKLLRKTSFNQLFKTKKHAKVQILTSKEDDTKKKRTKKKAGPTTTKNSTIKKKKNLNWE